MMRGLSVKLATVLAVIVVVACSRKDTADTGMTVSDTMAGVVDSAPATTAKAVAVLLTDENILAVLDTTYDAMLETDLLALDRTDNDKVRDFATRAVTQNAVADRAIDAVARRLKISPVLPDPDPIEGHADAMAMMRQRAGSDFDEIYLDHATEMRRQLLKDIDENLKSTVPDEATKKMLQELRSEVEADIKTLEALKSKAGA
jgi:predicted outer membrane protein